MSTGVHRKIEYNSPRRWTMAMGGLFRRQAEGARFAGYDISEDWAVAACRANIDGWLDGRGPLH